MTDEQINAAIAEACGWEKSPMGGISKRDQCGTLRIRSAVPDYCNDLNDMHEAEKVLTEDEVARYVTVLCLEVQPTPQLYHATARQRAEAFVRTLGKWEEAQP